MFVSRYSAALKSVVVALPTTASRAISTTSPKNMKVAVMGASGGIGQPMSMLFKLSPKITELSLYDVVNTPGVAADLSHISTNTKVKGYVGPDQLDDSLKGCDVVVIPAGVPRKPGMTRDDLFNTNASIVQTLIEGVARNCPNACINIISNPVNSTVPIAAEVLKNHGVYNPKKLFGVTTLDVVRANTFVAEAKDVDVKQIDVPVVGGHAGTTIVPLLSQTDSSTVGPIEFSDEVRDALTNRIQFGGDEVVQAKDGLGSATLSMAYAGVFFTERLLEALEGESVKNVCTFVESDVTSSPFFSSRVDLGPDGVELIHGLGDLTPYEQELVNEMLPALTSQVQKGIDFVKKQ